MSNEPKKAIEAKAMESQKKSNLETLQSLDFSGSVESIKAQKEGIEALQNQMAEMLAKLKQEKPDLDLRKTGIKDLPKIIAESHVKWSAEEGLAILKLKEGLRKLGWKPPDLVSGYWNPVIEKAESAFAVAELKAQVDQKKAENANPESPSAPESATALAAARAEVERKKLAGQVRPERAPESPESIQELANLRNSATLAIQELLKSEIVKPNEVGKLLGQAGWKELESKASGSSAEVIRQVSALSPEAFGKLGVVSSVMAASEQWERDKALAKAKDGEGLWEKVSSKTKKFYKEHTGFCQVALVAAGAYGSYKLIKYLWGRETKEETKEGQKKSWLPNPLALGAVAVAGIGVYLGRNKIVDWFKEKFGGLIGQAETAQKTLKMIEAILKGDYATAFALYNEVPDPKADLHKKSSEMLMGLGVKVPTDVLKNAGPMSYEAYMKQQDSLFAYLENRAQEFTGEKWLVALYKTRTDFSDGQKQLFGLFKSLEATKDASGKPLLERSEAAGKTVDDVLEIVLKKDPSAMKVAMSKTAEDAAKNETEAKKKEEESLVSKATKETAESYTSLFSDLKEEALDQLPPKVKEVIIKYKAETEANDWEKKNLIEKGTWIGSYAYDVLTATLKESGTNLLVSAGGIFFQSAKETGKWVLIGSNKTVVSAFWELATLNPKGAFESYVAGTTPFMIAGGVIGLRNGPIGGLKGALKGFKLPWKIVKKEYEIVTNIGYYGRPDVANRYASLGLLNAENELKHRARWLTHWGAANRIERRLVNEADTLIALEEHLDLIEHQIDYRTLGKDNKKLEELSKELRREIADFKEGLKKGDGATILENRRSIRLQNIFGKNAEKAIKMIKGNETLERIFLEQGSRKVVREILKTNRPELFVELLQGKDGEKLLKILEEKELLGNRKFLTVMDKFDNLFSRTGVLDQKILAEIVEKAEKLDMPLYEKMLAKIAGVIEAPLKTITEWPRVKKALEVCIGSFNKYLKVPMSGAMARYKLWSGPKFDNADLENLLKERNPTKIRDFLRSRGIKGAERLSGEQITKMESVKDIRLVIEEAAKAEGKIARFAPGVSRFSGAARAMRYARFAPKVGVAGLAFLPAGFDLWEAIQTKNREKSGMLTAKGLGNAVVAGVETGVLLGASAAAGGAVSAAMAAPTYMWNTGYESAMEQIKKSGEWKSEYDKETLIHQWLSTGIGTAGEAYHRAFTSADTKSYDEAFRNTRKEILKSILSCDVERFTGENEYRMAYFEKSDRFDSPGFDYSKALEALHDSRLYAETMLSREAKTEKLGKLNLAEARFDPEKSNSSDITELVVAKKREVNGAAYHVNRALVAKFDKMATGDLVDLCWQLDKAIENPSLNNELSGNEENTRNELGKYLFYARKVEAKSAIRNLERIVADERIVAKMGKLPEKEGELKKAREEALAEVGKEVDLKATLAKVDQLESEGETVPEETPVENGGVYAMAKLAEFLGYEGQRTENGLRSFFAENRGDAFGVYFKDGAWHGNESWWKDKDLGPALNESMVQTLVAHFRKNPKDILEHRGESLALWSEGAEFEDQVLKRAAILEKALEEYSAPKEKVESAPIA